MVIYLTAFLVGLGVLILDQVTKYFISAVSNLQSSFPLIKGLINITYTTNDGGAWNFLGGKTVILLAITLVVMIICVVLLMRYLKQSKLMLWALTLVLSGGIGNFIDRVFRNGEVVDFIQFDFWKDFPVFNIADCAIVVGAGLLILYFVLDTIKEIKTKNLKEAEIVEDENS